MPSIDYYFTVISPYAYLGHAALLDLARETGASLRYRPVRIFELFEANGGLPLGLRAPARQRYRLVELQRWREARDLTLNLQPRHFPADPSLADCCAIALAGSGLDPGAFVASAFRAVWAEDRDIASKEVVASLLETSGFESAAVMEAAAQETVRASYAANTAEAIAADLPGLPGYVLNGEPFWGQDRIDALRTAVVSGRAPYPRN
ncbi:2-hydroxychromene-2-carboxylate isomerase [Marilutibacter chinensis]|uniref:2-hydroxychromene-2-carboxylate isomerase n=1 Tax=Marilutibacter chinensis TaxID=2912247 RepID=A0ABS9HUK9_9GAMM|nr:2-hydroxychromene-2-carboxylate isomerase [Lysobacter chinensis]MCF7222550.1 2-hydroxychromene-2-carboxylate isomerase [Lysobacter chinensis]